MGAVFAILFFLFSFGGGAAVFLAGTVGLIISGNRKKKGMPLPKGFTAVFSVLLSVGLAVTLIPIGFFGFIATEVTDKMQIVHKIIELPAGMTDALLAIHKKYFTLGAAGVFLRLDWN